MPEIEISDSGVMIKCNPSRKYIELLKRTTYDQAYVLDNVPDMLMEDRILQLIEEEPSITQNKIADNIKVTAKTVKRKMAKMKQDGVIQRVGSDRKGYWDIKKK